MIIGASRLKAATRASGLIANRSPSLRSALVTGAIALYAACAGSAAYALEKAASAPTTTVRPGPAWQMLSPLERAALSPLQRDWPTIDTNRKKKWLEVANMFPDMPQAERDRVQQRMAEWARLTPAERGRARQQFQETRQFSPQDRQQQWDAYQALPEQTKQELAQRAKPVVAPKAAALAPDARGQAASAQGKRNIVGSSGPVVAKSVGPTVVQAKPGATTTLLTKGPTPPAHQQPGLPKIAATEGFVNPATLLPQRGPQGAAVRSAAAAASQSLP